MSPSSLSSVSFARVGGRYAQAIARFGILAVLVGVGCSGLGDILGVQEPTASYRDFTVESLTLDEIGFDLAFDLGNPNSFALPVATLDWRLDLFDGPFSFGQIRFQDPTDAPAEDSGELGVLTYLGVRSIPANGQLQLDAPFGVALLDTFEGLSRIALGEDVPFLIEGTIHLESRFGDFDLPFSESGVWDNAELLDFLEEIGSDALDDLIGG